MIKHNNT